MNPSHTRTVVVCTDGEEFRLPQLRLLEEAARRGRLQVCLESDAAIQARTGRPPRFNEDERAYLWGAVRQVDRVWIVNPPPAGGPLPVLPFRPDLWVDGVTPEAAGRRAYCAAQGMEYLEIPAEELARLPVPPLDLPRSGRPRVLVTGCYDWFHSGHVRFFEEAAEHGELVVVVGNDANVEHLKGPGHPLFREGERRYIVGAIRHVALSLVSTGMGWMDAEPEIARLRPDIYLVNEDGDRPEKRRFCDAHGLEYRILKRRPRPGLQARSSTQLRGF